MKPSIDRFGFPEQRGLSQRAYDLAALTRTRKAILDDGQEWCDLYRRVAEEQTPGYHEWHAWTRRQVNAVLENTWTGLAGCASSCKTWNLAGLAVNWWLVDPDHSAVILCCTSISALRRKLWAAVRSAFQAQARPLGNFIDSRRIWQSSQGDDFHAIQGIAVEEGSPTKVADNIKGIHPDRLLIVLDEATSIPTAIFDACSNLWEHPYEFHLVMMFNPRSRFDQAGKFAEPKAGWNTVNVDTESWETKPQMDNRPGWIERFDALKSPNIGAAKNVSRYLPKPEGVKAAVARYGSENNPSFWSNFRGFWPPEGLTLTVCSEPMLARVGAAGKWTFSGPTRVVGGFDPAFTAGGDVAYFRPARIGLAQETGRVAVQLLNLVAIPVDAKSSEPVSYQLMHGLRRAAESLGSRPEDILVDASAAGVCDVCQREWSPRIGRCLFQGKPSERTISNEDPRRAVEVYANMRCELWFQAAEFFGAGQVRGLDADTATEFCSALYTSEADGGKRTLESKAELKVRLGHSPDAADATALALLAVRLAGVEIAATGLTAAGLQDWDNQAEQAHAAEADTDYAAGPELQSVLAEQEEWGPAGAVPSEDGDWDV